jgi:hypothetical protein
MAMENPTSPLRYSFLSGLKNVCNKSGRENSLKKALLREIKNITSVAGLSTNQNLRNIIGSFA